MNTRKKIRNAQIHFICKGNVFRSRLAEAYLRSILPNVTISSSGVEASKNSNGPIGWYAARLLKKYNLVRYMSNFWQQTTKTTLKYVKMAIFLGDAEFFVYKKIFGLPKCTYDVWNIDDLADHGYISDYLNPKQELDSILLSERIFKKIQSRINILIKSKKFKLL